MNGRSSTPPTSSSDDIARGRQFETPLTISAAKRELARSLGIPESSITITIEA